MGAVQQFYSKAYIHQEKCTEADGSVELGACRSETGYEGRDKVRERNGAMVRRRAVKIDFETRVREKLHNMQCIRIPEKTLLSNREF